MAFTKSSIVLHKTTDNSKKKKNLNDTPKKSQLTLYKIPTRFYKP